MTRVNLTELYPIRPDETAAEWTDRLLHHARYHETYRQCSIGYHDECSVRDLGASSPCSCTCHDPEPEKPSEALQEACRHVLGYHHLEGGYPPGGFTAQLIELWAKADMTNRHKLGWAFPEMAYAIDLFQNGQEDALRAVAEGVALR